MRRLLSLLPLLPGCILLSGYFRQPFCGDGLVTPDAGFDEECDDQNNIDGDGCDSNCTETDCGNGITSLDQDGNPEECDDGNNANDDGCDDDCLIESCGDGIVDTNEECDGDNLNGLDCTDLGLNGTLSCDAACELDESQCAP